MPSVGPRPKPTALKELAGNPGRRPLNKAEPKAPKGKVTCPMELSAEAQKEWDRIVPDLEAMGVLSRIDTTALVGYCESWAQYVDAQKMLRKSGAVIKSSKGYLIQNPYLKVANQALDQMRRFMVEFGMTPSSRSRVNASEPEEESSPWDKFKAIQ